MCARSSLLCRKSRASAPMRQRSVHSTDRPSVRLFVYFWNSCTQAIPSGREWRDGQVSSRGSLLLHTAANPINPDLSQPQMEELIRVLEKTVSSLQADQNESVKYIQEYVGRDFSGFLQALSDVLYNQQNPPVVRAAAGLQLKNQLTARDETQRQQQQERWRSLPEQTRLHIKERVFKSLGTEIFRPSSAPQCVAYIALIELPQQQWPGLIPALASNVTNRENPQPLRLASVEAIGYICQDIDQSRIQPTDANLILDAIVNHGMNDDQVDDIKRAATTALLNLSEHTVKKISKLYQSISFAKLGELIGVEARYAEKIVAQMIREERLQGHLNQIEGILYFDSKDVLQLFDEEILKLCSEVNDIIEKIKDVVPEEWWATNAHQTTG